MLAERMRAIDPTEAGGPDVLTLTDRPIPVPREGEVLVRVAAAGVNRADLVQREGKYPPPKGAPTIFGMELAGEVVALGDGVDEGMLGQKICSLIEGGGYADYAAVPAAYCLPVPDTLSMVEAAALPEAVMTVWSNVFDRGGAKPGETLLVHGGASGIGTTAILLGRQFGLTVIVTCGGPEKCARALEIGAAHAIDYKAQDFVAEVKTITEGRGVDLILDMIGGDYLPRNVDCLAAEGRHVSIATQRGLKGELPIWKMMAKRLTFTGSTLRARERAFKAALRDEILAKVWPLVEDGTLRPVVDRTFPLADAAEAHRYLDSGAHVGKVVLTVGDVT